MKKLTILFAALTLSVGLWAETQTVSYRYPVYKTADDPTSGIKEWKTEYVEATVVENSTWSVTWNAGWYVVTGENVQFGEHATCTGAVNIILADGAKLTATGGEGPYAGIQVSGEGNSLTIYGQANQSGQLIATGGSSGAGIGGGGGNNGSGSNITINGGIVTATGGSGSAGIGGAGQHSSSENITINGGIVTATGGYDGGAGIGGGIGKNGDGRGSNITINGGTVTATAKRDGAGIGGGGISCAGSNITINGGIVTATVGQYGGAGIGGGNRGAGSNITITGGDVTANGGKYDQITISAGIGNGYQSEIAASDIKVATTHIVTADGNNPPTTVIENNGDDIASSLAGKQYVTIKITDNALLAYRAAAIEEIEAAIEGIANGDIHDIADKAKEAINAATTEEDVNSIKNKALADIEEATIYLPQTKADAIAEIDAAVKDVIDADILAIANKAKTDINNAIKVEKVITIKTQALAELAIAVKYYNSGKAAALGTMGTPAAGQSVIVTDGTTTVKLYNPTSVTYHKEVVE